MKTSNPAKKILAALVIASCAAFAEPTKPVEPKKSAEPAKQVDSAKTAVTAPVVDSTKALVPAVPQVAKPAMPAKHEKPVKAAKPAAEPAMPAEAAAATEPVNDDRIRGAKTCEDLKEKIAAKMERKGRKNVVLTVTPKEEAGKVGKIVGSCEGGSKKIVYTKG